jgi:hypothetical protein
MILLEVVFPLKLYQNTKFHGPTLTGVGFAPPQKIGMVSVKALEMIMSRSYSMA